VEKNINNFELFEKLVKSKLEINKKIKYELDWIKRGPDFIVESFLKAYQHIILHNNVPTAINECHSLIAYELNLTTMHPGKISFHYPVEPGSLPDYDVDYANPEAIKEYVRNKYGSEKIIGISTYGKYKVKSLLYDLCRVLTDDDGELIVQPEETRELNKKLPFKIDAQISEDMADEEQEENNANSYEQIFTNKDIQDFGKKYPKIFEHFKTLYSSYRYRGSHAAGIVILSEDAKNLLPLCKTKGQIAAEFQNGQGVDELASVGAIKIDVLGLKTLKILDTCNKLILNNYNLNENSQSPCNCAKENKYCKSDNKIPFLTREYTKEHLIDFDKICLNVPKIYKELTAGNTEGVFQFEPEGITSYLQQFQPHSLLDLATITAAYRPGLVDLRLDNHGEPIDTTDISHKNGIPGHIMLLKRRKGELPIVYPSQKVREILKNSSGLAIFQESLSQMIMAMTNGTFAEAEKIRKFLTKVKPELVHTDQETIEKIDKFYISFAEKSFNNNCTQKEIEAVWNMIVPFARYGFCLSHAIAYSIISYQTAWCRTLFPLQYLTSLMIHNVDNNDKDKIIQYIRTAQKLGFKVNPPDINLSFENFTINHEQEIVSGLTLIKGVGDKSVVAIVNNRNDNGLFTSIDDFLSRDIRWTNVNIGVLHKLVHAGAFDSISPNRKLTWAKILVAKKKKIEETEEFKGIKSFETIVIGEDENGNEIKEIYLEDYSNVQKSTYARELFGFSFEDYITKNKDMISRYKNTLNIIASQKKKQVSAGTVEEIKVANQKNGQQYARITVTNLDGIKEQWLLFAHIWSVYKNNITIFETYFAIGKKDDRTLLVDTLKPIGELLELN